MRCRKCCRAAVLGAGHRQGVARPRGGQGLGVLGEHEAVLVGAGAEGDPRAGLRADQIDVVLRTGGSSLIPAVRRILDDRFPTQVVDHDPFTSVAAGLAIASYRRLDSL